MFRRNLKYADPAACDYLRTEDNKLFSGMRATYDQSDYTDLTSNSRFMVAIDAYRLGRCTLAHVLGMSLLLPFYGPNSLSPRAFAALAIRIAQEIGSGVLSIDPASQVEFATFYEQQEVDID